MNAKEFFESQLITDSLSVIDKMKHKFSKHDLINFADAYASQKEPTCNCPFNGHTAECDNCDLNKAKVIMKKDKSNICFNWGCTVHNEDNNSCKYNNKGCESRKLKKIIIKSIK